MLPAWAVWPRAAGYADSRPARRSAPFATSACPAAEAVFRTRTLPATAAQTRAALANTAALAADSFGALVSLVYNRGPSFAAAGARYLEMRAIAAAMASRDFGAVPAQFRAMKRLWQSDPALAGLVARREQEAILFEAGLAEAAG
jgi:GH24 family phage-related lysozyme (muramidase)